MSMLQQGQIPNTEPTIRVGILLPQDNLPTMTLSLSDPAAFKVSTDRGYLTTHKITQKMIINIQGQSLELSCLPDQSIQNLNIDPITDNSEDSHFTVKGVPAGRGFHWEKLIQATFAGKAHIYIKDGALVLVNEIPLEAYLKCVATSEMSAACPLPLIEAQTIVARSWLLANVEQKHTHLGFDVCNDDCCQRYQGIGNLTAQTIAGSDHTRGQVLIYEGEICDARYSKSCGGMTERFENVWDGNSKPYLINVPDLPDKIDSGDLRNDSPLREWLENPPEAFCSSATVPEDTLKEYIGNVDKSARYFRWHVSYSENELTKLVNEKLNLEALKVTGLAPLKRGGSGRIIKLAIHFANKRGHSETIELESEYEIRRVLHPAFLYSSAFLVEHEENIFILTGAGWGHGVGLCQIGALGMALKGFSAHFILKHYYPGSILKKIYT